MVRDYVSIVILELCNGILPIIDCGHRMEEFGGFIPKFNSVDCVSFLPVDVHVPQKILQALFNDHSQIPFWQGSTFFQGIQNEDNFVTNVKESAKIGQVLAPRFETVSSIFQLSTNNGGSIPIVPNLFLPSTLD
jgi:hypothetical protein